MLHIPDFNQQQGTQIKRQFEAAQYSFAPPDTYPTVVQFDATLLKIAQPLYPATITIQAC